MANDPLEKVFETPEESLAWYLKQMPASLIPVFQREFMRRPTPRAADGAVCDLDHDMLALEGHSTCPNCGAIPPRR